MNTKHIGNIGESKIISEFLYHGIPVYLPFGDNEACDMIADFDGKLQRIQVKTTSAIRNGKMSFSLGSRRYGVDHSYSDSEVDYFAMYCIENDQSYIIKNDPNSNNREITLRTEPARNGQVTGVRMAVDYKFENKFNAG